MPLRDGPATPESAIERNHRILADVKPEDLIRSEPPFTRGTHAMHPNDVARVVDKLKAHDVEFDDVEHSKGSVEIFGKKIYWQIRPDNKQRPVWISESKF